VYLHRIFLTHERIWEQASSRKNQGTRLRWKKWTPYRFDK